MDEIGPASVGIRIAHWTPGRVRICFEDSAAAEQFALEVVNLRGVTSAKSNSLTGTVLVHYTEGVDELRSILEPVRRPAPVTHHADQHVCVKCRQPLEGSENSHILRRILSLIAAILTGDLIGVVAWVWSAADAGQIHPTRLDRRLSLAA